LRAISLWQPWASAVALGLKRIETRHWPTSYRGPLLIHAAKRWTVDEREFHALEHEAGRLPAALPLGALIAVVDLVDCRRSEDLASAISDDELAWGNYGPRRFGWLFEGVQQFPQPVTYRGRQSFFDVPLAGLPEGLRSILSDRPSGR
jgi:hypothetical protein